MMITFSQSKAQSGHVLQHVGAFNTSMGGASTAMPLDIAGTMQWNVAGLSAFNEKKLSLNAGIFFSDPDIFSTVQTPNGAFSGSTGDDRGASMLPSAVFIWGNRDSRHTFGVSASGVAGFGVTFPQSSDNPITLPQSQGGFGRIESEYNLLQFGFAYTYQLTDRLSIGIKPTGNFATLEIAPNPLAVPDANKGFPVSDNATAFGVGVDLGLFYRTETGLSVGASYKTPQFFGDFESENTFLDGSRADDVSFNLDYPAIYSFGLGYSQNSFDIAVDYRFIDYANTDGFEETGWEIAQAGNFAGFPTGAVKGFGWESIHVLSMGVQYSGIQKLPIRAGYIYNTNPIDSDVAFLSAPATAVIQDSFQIGFGYEINPRLTINTAYHHGSSMGQTSGLLLNPTPDVAGGPGNAQTNPLGKVPGSEVAFDMTTDMLIFGVVFNFTNQ